jgi:prolipoprotein diacylglyceryltransferase
MHATLDLFFFDLPVYTALVVMACTIGLGATYAYLRSRAARASRRDLFLNGALLVFGAGWIGARAYHVGLHWDYYAARPDEIAQWGAGGLGLRGALVAGFAALALVAWLHKTNFWKIADGAALGLTLGSAVGWYAALTRGANYGVVSDSRLALELPDIYGLVEPRLPLQHAEMALFAALFIALVWLAARPPRAGTLFLVALAASAWGNFALGFFRGDESVFIGALRVDQIIDAGIGTTALTAFLWWSRMKKQNA